MKTVDKTLSQRIHQARTDAGLSQQELAGSIGVSDKSISAYEKGRAVPPLGKLKSISAATHYPVSYFTDDETDSAVLQQRVNELEKELERIKKLLKKPKI